MLLLACACGVATLAGFVLQRAHAMPEVALGLFALAYLCGSWFAAQQLWPELRRGIFDINLLMLVVAAGAATIGAWAEGGTLLFLFSLSNGLEAFANHRTERTIDSLLKSAPETATRRQGERWTEIPVESIGIDDELLVRPGELFPTDGIVLDGRTSVDESALTGESLPVTKTAGAAVFGGTISLDGQATVRVTRFPHESAVQRVIDLIKTAQTQKAPSQRFTDTFVRYYTSVALGGSGLFFVVLVFAMRMPFAQAFYRTMTLLVVSSPCALVLSIPSAILVAIAAGARAGVLFRGGVAVETLAKVDRFAFDKTGTLTTGTLEVIRIQPPQGLHENEVLGVAASVCHTSTHPLSRAISRTADERALQLSAATDVQNIPGYGIEAKVDGERALIGSRALLRQSAIDFNGAASPSAAAEVCVALGARAGVIHLRDTIREAAPGVVAWLRSIGSKVTLISGDREEAANTIAAAVSIEDVRAGLSPEQKVEAIREWQRAGETVAMIGDGINDAPSLTTADVGIGMGARGSDAALEQADVILMHDRIQNVRTAVEISRKARRIIQQNVVVSLGAVLVLVLSALGQKIDLSVGVVGHEGSTVLVVLNGLRLLRKSAAIDD